MVAWGSNLPSLQNPIGLRVQPELGDQPVSDAPAVLLSDACQLGCQCHLGCCEPDLHDLAELHMLLGLPEIVIVLHGQPTLRRTAKRLGKA